MPEARETLVAEFNGEKYKIEDASHVYMVDIDLNDEYNNWNVEINGVKGKMNLQIAG